MKKHLKKIPHFNTEDAEREFWAKADTSEYFDFSKAKRVTLPNLKPSTEKISLRLPANLLYRIKTLANRSDIPYQSYMKIILSEKIQESFGRAKRPAVRGLAARRRGVSAANKHHVGLLVHR
ncbi:MAG: BrnA antitoxin family protein [Chitinivibrionales bacterium]|nr:BrnA antitoxin family protein [Chitinivibrionales bacterium]